MGVDSIVEDVIEKCTDTGFIEIDERRKYVGYRTIILFGTITILMYLLYIIYGVGWDYAVLTIFIVMTVYITSSLIFYGKEDAMIKKSVKEICNKMLYSLLSRLEDELVTRTDSYYEYVKLLNRFIELKKMRSEMEKIGVSTHEIDNEIRVVEEKIRKYREKIMEQAMDALVLILSSLREKEKKK